MILDLNCDLGEGEPAARTRELMRWITSANVACGGHAGDAHTMVRCVQLARENQVRLGAHPGPWNRNDFGRGALELGEANFELLLLQQISALERIARAEKASLHHIKLHGALYHLTERDEALAKVYLAAARRWWPSAKIYALAGGRVARLASQFSRVVWPEVFADRAYERDGSLVPRGNPGALLHGAREIRQRVRAFLKGASISTIEGGRLLLRPRTICVHGDSPKAIRTVRVVREELCGGDVALEKQRR